MFIVRAIFWFTLVGLMMPQAPGTPSAGAGEEGSSAIIKTLQASALAHLSRVRAELEARHARES